MFFFTLLYCHNFKILKENYIFRYETIFCIW